MQRGSRTNTNQNATSTDTEGQGQAVGQFLRGLATRAEADPALAAQIQGALQESGLLAQHEQARKKSGGAAKGKAQPTAASAPAETPPDPFQALREHGEAGLRATLESLDLAALRTIVRTHRLDPARISARWNARERVIELIVTQVIARANQGKAFSHV